MLVSRKTILDIVEISLQELFAAAKEYVERGPSLALLDLKISPQELDKGSGTPEKQKRQLPEAVPAHGEGSSRAATALAALLHFLVGRTYIKG
jgi:hypothetical protein